MVRIENVGILTTLNVPTEWLQGLLILAGIASVIRWLVVYGDVILHELGYHLIQRVIDVILHKINIVQAFIDNGFVDPSNTLNIVNMHAYLTEFIRGVKRILQLFGFLIDQHDRLGLPLNRLDRLYITLHEAISTLTDLYEQIGNQMGLISVLAQ